MNKIVALCFLLLPLFSHALELTYHLSMPQPNSHYFAVKIDVKGNTANTQEFKLPVWTPGSYLVREFSKNLNQVKAIDINNKELVVNKKTKNAWEIQCAGQENFTIFYEVYAFELSVRTPYLDNTHGFVAGRAITRHAQHGSHRCP
jgi:predicted metalloprotease with PDZ domain